MKNHSFGAFSNLSDSGIITFSKNLPVDDSGIPGFDPSKIILTNWENEERLRLTDTLQSLVESCLGSNPCLLMPPDKSIKSCNCSSERKNLKFQPDNLILKGLRSKYSSRLSFTSYRKNNGCSRFRTENQLPAADSNGARLFAAKNAGPKKANKTRIRWTDDLHCKFMESVCLLGGAKYATPKEILKLMSCDGVTIFHVKSHLQKFRVSQLMEESKEDHGEQIDRKMRRQFVDAIRRQLDVQQQLYEQLESQKKLQTRIEEQAKELHTIIKSQLNKR